MLRLLAILSLLLLIPACSTNRTTTAPDGTVIVEERVIDWHKVAITLDGAYDLAGEWQLARPEYHHILANVKRELRNASQAARLVAIGFEGAEKPDIQSLLIAALEATDALGNEQDRRTARVAIRSFVFALQVVGVDVVGEVDE